MNSTPQTSQSTNPSFATDLAFCISPESSRHSSIRIVEPSPEDAYANRGNLYILVELLSEGPGHATLLRQMLNTVQQIYYTAKGSQSSVLEQAINAANSLLQQANLKNRQAETRAGITCVTLLRDQLTVAAVGPSLAILASRSSVDHLTMGADEFGVPLGGIEPPEIDYERRTVRADDVFFLGESEWLARLRLDVVAAVLAGTSQENRFKSVDYLRERITPAEIQGLMVVLSVAASPAAQAQTTQTQTPSPSPADRPTPSTLPRSRPAPSRTGLPSAVGATPPVRDVPPAPRRTPPPARARPPERAASRGSQGEPPVADAARPQRIPRPDLTRSEISRRAESPQAATQIAPQTARQPDPGPSMMARGMAWASNLFSGMLPDRSGAGRPRQGSDRFIPARDERARPAQPARMAGTEVPATVPPPQPKGPSPLAAAAEAVADFQPPAPARGGRARIFISLAVLILVVTSIGVATIYLRGATNRADAEQLVSAAESNLFQARGMIDQGEDAGARNLLSDAQSFLDQAALIVGNTQQITTLDADIEKELQSVLKIFTLYGLDIPLERFANGSPSEVVVSDQDVYVLDTGRQVVEHLRLDAQREVVEERTGVILREGDVVGGVTVGRLVDMTWEPRNTGFVDKPGLLILDRNNRIFRYNRVDGASVLVFSDQASWQMPVQLSVYGNGWIYMADQGRQQIYKYEPFGNGYEADPTPWLAAQTVINLTGLDTMRIDGDVWLLYENGQVLRYFGGEQVAFALENNVGRIEDPRDMVVEGGRIYLADAAGARILVYNRENGSYERQYQAADVDLLRGLRSIHVDETSGKLFLLTQTGLYQQTLPQ